MATMDRDAMLAYVRDMLGNLSTPTDAKIEAQLNRVYKQLAIAFKFHEVRTAETQATVADTQAVALSAFTTTPRVVMSVFDQTNKKRLRRREFDWLDSQDFSSGKEEAPQYWVRWGSDILLHPTPDAIYTLRFRFVFVPDDMSTGASVPVIPEDWHEVIPLMTAMRWLFINGQDRRAMNAKNEALGLISGLVEDETMARKFDSYGGQIMVERKGRNG